MDGISCLVLRKVQCKLISEKGKEGAMSGNLYSPTSQRRTFSNNMRASPHMFRVLTTLQSPRFLDSSSGNKRDDARDTVRSPGCSI